MDALFPLLGVRKPRGRFVTFEGGDGCGINATSAIRAKAILRSITGNIDNPGGEFVGQPAEEVIRRLQGIRCGMRPTSCPDQLAEALTEALEQI